MPRKKDTYIKYSLIALISLLILAGSFFKVFEIFELQTVDLRLEYRPPQQVNDNIVLIEIGEDSIKTLGRWPFDRKYHALLIEALNEAGARQVIFDILFTERSPDDMAMVQSSIRAQNVYYSYAFVIDDVCTDEVTASKYEGKIIEQLKTVAAGIGHINIVPDIDGKNRKVPVYIKYQDEYYPHVSFKAVCDYLGAGKADIEFIPQKSLIIKPPLSKKIYHIPINTRNELLINYAGKWGVFEHYSYVDIISSHQAQKVNQEPIIDLSRLKGKVCIVGGTATGLHDLHPVPFAKRYPGMGVHANLYNSVSLEHYLIRADRWVNLIVLAGLLALIIYISRRAQIVKGLIYVVCVLVGFTAASYVLYAFFGVWIDLFYPVAVAILLYLVFTFFRLIAERHQRELIEKELSVARRIQESFLPKKPPHTECFEIASSMNAARQVGGDLFQFIEIDENKFGSLIADVSGKGIPAALFMVNVVSEFKTWAKQTGEPDAVLAKVNAELAAGAKTGLFVTVSYALIDCLSRKVSLADGGHLPVMWYKASEDKIEEARPTKGMPLGLMPKVNFNKVDFTLSSGDVMVFYTDGVTEARNTKQEEFGFERIKEQLQKSAKKTADEILKDIKGALNAFTYKAPQHDDITLIVIKTK